jgi:hypothetical protein
MEIDPNELVPSDETAKLLNVKPQTMVTWRHEGKGPRYLKIGRSVFYRRSDIRAYLGALLTDPVAKARGRAA